MLRTFSVTLVLDTDAPLDPDFDRGVVIADMGTERLYERLNGLLDGTFRGAHVSAVREVAETAAPAHGTAHTSGPRMTGADITKRQAAALRIAQEALATIVAEAPTSEPAYPRSGGKKAREAWGFDSARWEAAVTARPALEAVNEALARDPS